MRYGKWGASFDPSETAETGQIARRLGGYDEMLRLERDLTRYKRNGIQVRMVLDDQGRRQLQPIEKADMPTNQPPATPSEDACTVQAAPARGMWALLRRLLPR